MYAINIFDAVGVREKNVCTIEKNRDKTDEIIYIKTLFKSMFKTNKNNFKQNYFKQKTFILFRVVK